LREQSARWWRPLRGDVPQVVVAPCALSLRHSVFAPPLERGTNDIDEAAPMQAEIQPKYGPMKAVCSCGNVIETRSTVAKEIHLDVCSECHPFYTGKQNAV